MKIREIVVESQLQEGPFLNKIGSAVGKGVGALAKGVGAVAGGVAGLGSAVKKGFQAGKQTVAGAGDDNAPAPKATAAKPAAGAPAAKPATQTLTNPKTPGAGAAPAQTPAAPAPAAGSGTTATPPAEPAADGAKPDLGRATRMGMAQGAAKALGIKDPTKGDGIGQKPETPAGQEPAAGGTTATPPAAGGTTATPPAAGQEPATKGGTAATPPAKGGKTAAAPADQQPAANDSEYSKAQKAVDGLPPEQKKELIAALQADPKVKAAMAKPAAKKPAAKKPAAAPANTMANAPVSKVNKAKPAASAAAPAAKAEPTATTGTVKQKQLTNKGFGQMVGQLGGAPKG